MAETNVDYYETDWRDTVGYTAQNLGRSLAKIPPTSILDIGAAHGDFSLMMSELFELDEVTMVEANPLDAHYLEKLPFTYIPTALSLDGTDKIFYTNPDDPVGGGSSLYKENTDAFSQPTETVMKTKTLDSLGVTADLVKIDTQGSELDIMLGGENTLKEAKYLLLELSFIEYNQGAPLIDDILAYTREKGFRMIDTFGPQLGGHWYNGRKCQVDVLLAKKYLDLYMV